ncbi:hypothetical protein Rhe02_89770 [Rhizocola hellebori]|uniref:PE domain-containing protein n=1 Tax=Rhizocola hellebori TaxID=1392758 RepID=A0A8J3QJJ4_9ACTN|nr:hypothetical protein [Rhizocola hellebori]GIH10910.1 hypothetical protein Rhe02_89770 [Rhizocola hellebori]
MASEELIVDVSSLEKAAATLRELATDLQASQVDLFVLEWADAPRSHPEVARVMRGFGEFAHDQYRAAVALFAALATKVGAAATGYRLADESIAQFLADSTYRPPR